MDPEPDRLSAGQAAEVLRQIAELSGAALPLASGLRAAACDAGSSRVAQAMHQLAARLEGGQPLEQALAAQARGFPGYLSGLVAAATKTGRLNLALDELVSLSRSAERIWWSLIGSLIYPMLVLALAGIFLSLLLLVVVPPFGRMFNEFNLNVPAATQVVIRSSEVAQRLVGGVHAWFSLGSVGLFLAVVFGARALLGAAGWHRLLGTIPIVGPIWAWMGAVTFSRMLAVLTEHGVPLPLALELTAEGTRDPNVREACRDYAGGVEQGIPLSDQLSRGRHMPATLVPFVDWGERSGQLADGLRTAGDMYEERLRMRATMLVSVSPAVVFVFVSLSVAVSVVALVLPLLNLVQGLS